MKFSEMLLLAVGLSYDAFAVSVCGSMVYSPDNRWGGALRFGIWFGFFQFLMPVLGFMGSISFTEYIVDYDHWLAFSAAIFRCKI